MSNYFLTFNIVWYLTINSIQHIGKKVCCNCNTKISKNSKPNVHKNLDTAKIFWYNLIIYKSKRGENNEHRSRYQGNGDS